MIATMSQAGALVELGAVILGLAVVARFAHRFAFSPIPAYLLAGLAVRSRKVPSVSISARTLLRSARRSGSSCCCWRWAYSTPPPICASGYATTSPPACSTPWRTSCPASPPGWCWAGACAQRWYSAASHTSRRQRSSRNHSTTSSGSATASRRQCCRSLCWKTSRWPATCRSWPHSSPAHQCSPPGCRSLWPQ